MLSNKISNVFKQLSSAPGTPKYQQICATLLSMIESGELKPGDRVPTETSLTESLPVSLGTVQKALNTLTERGVLTRKQGSGTYVADKQISPDDIWHFRFIDDGNEHIMPLTTKVLDIKRSIEPGPWVHFLGQQKFYICIVREIRVNNAFSAVSRFFLSGQQFKELLTFKSDDLEDTLLRDIISTGFGRSTDQIREQVVAQTFPDDICNRLELPIQSVGLVCHIMAYSQRNKPLSFQQLYVPANVSLLETREIKPG
ncbi:MAG: GntR family transcriptional regulator [Gammaproteobacteria bacterium]|nr:GntR family transcriptional regulator [Gammaproteobacteria bacterium]